MPREPGTYLTVLEAAERWRTSPQTVYRWCRAGKLGALKIGKEWRIPAGQLGHRQKLAGLLPLDALLAGLVNESEHVLAFADDRSSLARLEATFFEVATKSGARLVYGRWEETEADVRHRLRPVIKSARSGPSSLHVVNCLKSYEHQGPEAAVQPLLHEVERARANGIPCCVYGSCYTYFGYQIDRMSAYERLAQEQLRGQAALVVCGYAMNDILPLYEGRAVSLCTALMSYHTGVIWFDGQQALLQRPAG
jgi:excisionase family DNA binding protein